MHGWPENLKGPSSIPHNAGDVIPKEMSLQDIQEFKEAWAAGVKRALYAGFDVRHSKPLSGLPGLRCTGN